MENSKHTPALGCKLEYWSIYDWFQSSDYWLFDLFSWDNRIGDDGSVWEQV
jgi:hypothetical protein